MSISVDWKRKLRKKTLTTMIYFLDSILWFVEPSTRGYILYHLHFWIVGLLIILIGFFGRELSFQIGIFAAIINLCLFWFFDGCFMTRLEQHYTQGKTTVMDIFLYLFKVEPTNKKRYLISVSGFSLITLFFIIVYIRERVFGITCAPFYNLHKE